MPSSSAASSSASSSSLSSDSESSPCPVLPAKRKRESISDSEDSDSDADSESSDSNGDTEHEHIKEEEEAPALSHAEKRRQKKRLKLEAKAAKSKSASTSKSKSKPKSDASLPKRQHSVWVGNLSFKTTPEALKAFFVDGSAGEVTRVHMPMKAAKAPGKAENQGFAYVDFADVRGKEAAIAMSEKPLVGRRLLIKDGADFTGRPLPSGLDTPAAPTPASTGDTPTPSASTPANPLTGHTKTAQKILRAQKRPPAPTLFVGNLGFEATADALREFFDAHRGRRKDAEGKDVEVERWIRKVRMGTFEDSGLCKGFAFVDFTSTEHATAALINPRNYTFNGRALVLEYASVDAVRRGGGGRALGQHRPAKRIGPRQMKVKARQLEAVARRLNGEDVPAEVMEGKGRAEGAPAKGKEKGKTRAPAGEKHGGKGKRSKPGAALALAQRETAAIQPSQGKKVVF